MVCFVNLTGRQNVNMLTAVGRSTRRQVDRPAGDLIMSNHKGARQASHGGDIRLHHCQGGLSGVRYCQPAERGPAVSVCLLEAGPPDHDPLIRIPAGFIYLLKKPSANWLYDAGGS